MYIPFNELSEDARVWLYPCTQALTSEQEEQIEERLEKFVDKWLSHSRVIQGSSQIIAHRILCLAANQDSFNVGGCSLDDSTRFIHSLEKEFGIECFARTLMFYQKGDSYSSVSIQEISEQVSSGELTGDTLVFNLQAGTVAELKQAWMPLRDSPYANFM